jgi:hypothetical protein
VRTTVEGTVQAERLEDVGQDIFLKMCEGFHRLSFLFWTIGKGLKLFSHCGQGEPHLQSGYDCMVQQRRNET